MRRILSFAALLALCIPLLCGCSQSRQVENQAYVIVLGVDAAESGGIDLTAKIPVLAASSGDQPTSGDSYKEFSSTGTNYNTSLKNLHIASPRNLNLSQLELLVVSRELAEQPDFRSLIEDIAQTERLYTASYAVICNGKAKDFVAAIEPAVGSRLSLDIPAIFDNYSEQGLIPDSKLADLYYLTETIYSDPMIARAELLSEETAADLMDGEAVPFSKTHILGSTVFSNGELKADLTAEETMLASLIRNETKYFRFEVDGRVVEAAPYAPAGVSVDLSTTPAILFVKLRINIGTQEDMPDENRIKEKLTVDITNLIQKTRKYGVEPFGFAESAASKFATISQWEQFDWDKTYRDADVKVTVSLSRWDA